MSFHPGASALLATVAATGLLIGAAGSAAAQTLPPSAANAQSNLKNAQTVVEAWANGNGGRYPSSATTRRGESLKAALPKDPDSKYLPGVYFSAPAGHATADTYDLWAWSASNHTVYELAVRRGSTHYGSVARLKQNPTRTDPSSSITNWSTSPWES